MDIVEVRESEVWADSSLVARKFGMQHGSLVKTINRAIDRFEKFSLTTGRAKLQTEEREYRGQKFTAYLMNREMFSLISQRLTTKKALKWQIKFNDAFYAMEQRLLLADSNATDPAFLKIRNQGKISRLQETDIIKEFVEYATGQGSRKAKFYYKHLTNSCYRALGMIVQSKPKLRDTMDIMELAELQLMEHRAGLLLKKYMDLGRNYKDIYSSVKDDLLDFGTGLRIE